ncbi:hypothetical protein ABZP36_035873 [Zizania latifolia]
MSSRTPQLLTAASLGAPPAPMAANAKLMVATDRGECQQLKDLMNKDATTMVVVTSSCSSSSNKDAAADIPAAGGIFLPLLAAACSGDWKGVNFLLNMEEAEADPSVKPSDKFLNQLKGYTSGDSSNNGSLSTQPAHDIEEGASMPSLVQGVTPDGDCALHMVATHGDSNDFLRCTDIIYRKDNHLLFKSNNKGDTPLHCAARAGNSEMVFHLIDLAIDFGTHEGDTEKSLKGLLRKENKSKETALHEAVRFGDNRIVELLMTYDSKLATFPEQGTSPLYLSILLGNDIIAKTLYAMTGLLLEWNKNLATQGDKNGSTPLHFAASHSSIRHPIWALVFFIVYISDEVVRQVLGANGAVLYQPDNCGMLPIHVAASVGELRNIQIFVNEYPSSAGLRDKRGRTFLHIAVENKKVNVVGYACRNRSLAWVLNLQDNDGNTALHLAVEAASRAMVCRLCGNPLVKLNLVNGNGKTPLDIATNKVPLMENLMATEYQILNLLRFAGGMNGSLRRDHFMESYENIHGLTSEDHERKELDNMKELIQSYAIGAVLVATVSFGAAFAVPGGYTADDHTNGGTPTLAGSFAFDAFVIANTFAFVFSSIATIGLMRSGSPVFGTTTRKFFFKMADYFMTNSITCLIVAFTLGVYMVLAPVAHSTAIVVCFITPLALLFHYMFYWASPLAMVPALLVRLGPIATCLMYAVNIVYFTVIDYWPMVITFAWAAHRRIHHQAS